MKRFNVLDRYQSIHHHCLLEASAGTGKTFSIQNIVVRLMLETSPTGEVPLQLHEILVMTFTKAAVRDLRIRIRGNIEEALQYILDWMENKTIPVSAPDYLVAILENGFECVCQAKKRLQEALFFYEQAQIFTIHGFCARMLKQYALETNLSFQSSPSDEPLPISEMMRLIRDFFRTGLRPDFYSPAQLEIILKEDPNQSKLIKLIQNDRKIENSCPPYYELHQQFSAAMKNLKNRFNISSEQLVNDFKIQSPFYNNYKGGGTKAETLATVIRFAALFDKDEWSFDDLDELIQNDLVWVLALDPQLAKGKGMMAEKLAYPSFTEALKDTLLPLIQQARHFPALLARLGQDCRKLFKKWQYEEEKILPDDLLKKMDLALCQPQLVRQIQSTYRAAVVDEFQDTDPLQWKIFKQLFVPEDWGGHLYLVGDPKQSIYSFRQADIYTYLSAKEALGNKAYFSLDTNYRSQPYLVDALNTLFSPKHVPQLISLPKKNISLPYQPVLAGRNDIPSFFSKNREPIHFFIADGRSKEKMKFKNFEEDIFFPFLVNEIISLVQEEGILFRQIAILVRDRYQASRLAESLSQSKIPYVNQRGTNLGSSSTLPALIDVLRAVLHPHDTSAVKAALGGRIMGWTHDEVKNIENKKDAIVGILRLRHELFENGFSSFFTSLLNSVLERLLQEQDGLDFYHDLRQIGDIIMSHQVDWQQPEGLIAFLDGFKKWEDNEDARLKRMQDPAKNGVNILTLHMSKGLEFDVVFAMGLVNREGGKDDLIPVEIDGNSCLIPMPLNRGLARDYFEECDAEKMRQLYVSLTRAKYRLYIPAFIGMPSKDILEGEASPMDLFLARLNRSPTNYEELYERIRNEDNQDLISFLETAGKQNHISFSIHQKMQSQVYSEEGEIDSQLILPRPVKVTAPPITIASFTSLSLHSEVCKDQDSGIMAPHDFDTADKSVHSLPSSNETGTILHAILEKISISDFKHVKTSTEALNFIRPLLWDPKFLKWETVIADLVFNALKTPLAGKNGNFCLVDVLPTQTSREMPFLFSSKGGSADLSVEISDNFIKGVIDLIFYHQGYYYLLDWKSNWLGDTPEAYNQDALHRAMSENNYFLQAEIYRQALKKFLKCVEKRSFEECFGGTFYLFLRGLQPGSSTGICYVND